MQLPANFNNLIETANQLDLYQKLIKQLNKDLSLANIDLDFDEAVLPSSLKLILQETLFKLIQNKFSEYLNLLYIVDVSEQKLRELDGSDILNLSEEITFLVLQREWQKVWLRNQY